MKLLGMQGNVTRVDLRAKAFGKDPVNVHNRKINTIHFKQEQGAPEFVTSCSDGRVCVWDIRAFGAKAKPVASLGHTKSCHGALPFACCVDLTELWHCLLLGQRNQPVVELNSTESLDSWYHAGEKCLHSHHM
jgi:WD40 repeat protein